MLPLLVLAMLFLSLVFVMPGLQETRQPDRTGRLRTDLRSLAGALEAYRIEEGRFPAWDIPREKNYFAGAELTSPTLFAQLPTFQRTGPLGPASLTTPVVYLHRLPPDPTAPADGMSYCYWSGQVAEDEATTQGFLIWAAGPDRDYDLTLENLGQVYRPDHRGPSDELVELTYDPTNGLDSSGDFWRIRAHSVFMDDAARPSGS